MKNSGIAVQKPVPIQWFLWNGNLADLISWVESLGNDPENHFQQSLTGEVKLITKHSESTKLKNGQIIIRGITGDYFVTDSDDFNTTYNIL